MLRQAGQWLVSKEKKPKLKDASKLMGRFFGLDKHLKPRASELGDEDLGDGMFQRKLEFIEMLLEKFLNYLMLILL